MLGTLDKLQQSKTKSASLFLKMKKTKKTYIHKMLHSQNVFQLSGFATKALLMNILDWTVYVAPIVWIRWVAWKSTK